MAQATDQNKALPRSRAGVFDERHDLISNLEMAVSMADAILGAIEELSGPVGSPARRLSAINAISGALKDQLADAAHAVKGLEAFHLRSIRARRACHRCLFELLDLTLEQFIELPSDGTTPADLNRVSALLWIARDMAEKAGNDLEGLFKPQPVVAANERQGR